MLLPAQVKAPCQRRTPVAEWMEHDKVRSFLRSFYYYYALCRSAIGPHSWIHNYEQFFEERLPKRLPLHIPNHLDQTWSGMSEYVFHCSSAFIRYMKFLLVRHVHLPTLQTEEVGCSLPGCESTQQLPRKDGKTVRNTNYFSMSKTKSCNFKWHPLTPCRIPHTPSLSLLLNDVEHSTNYVKNINQHT